MATRPATRWKTRNYSLLRAMPLIRPSRADDLPAITAIYQHHVLHGTASFELDPPTEAEMARRRDDVLAKGLPYLAALEGDQLLGYAYAGHFRPRPAYRFCVENSIYLAPEAQGRGVGRALLAELITRCEAAGARQMVAVIGGSDNLGSIGLHRALGFEPAGKLAASGWKFGRWHDTVLMQRTLGPGATQPGADA